MGRRFVDRQALRQRTYAVVTILMLVIVGAVVLISLLAAGRQRVHTHLYRDADRTLLHVFAETETRWRFLGKHDSYATLEELVTGGAISEEFLAGPVEGFRYRVLKATPDKFVVTAEP